VIEPDRVVDRLDELRDLVDGSRHLGTIDQAQAVIEELSDQLAESRSDF